MKFYDSIIAIMGLMDCFSKNNKLDNKFNLLPDGIFTLEQDGKIIDVNDKILEIFNTTRFNILGHYFSDYIVQGSAILNEVIQDSSRILVNSTCSENLEFPKIFELTASRNPETLRVFVCIRDVTNEKEDEKELREKYAIAKKIVDEKNSFLSGISGNVLSNLVSISGFSRALLDGIAGQLTDKQVKYLNIINSTSKDLNYNLEKLFSLFKLESSQVKLNYKVFDIVSLIKSIERVYQKDFQDKKVIFNLNYSQVRQRDCFLDSEIVEYILRCILDIFLNFSNFGKCFLNVGHPPIDFLKSREFEAKITDESEKYILFEAKITDLVFDEDELANLFDAYYKSSNKRPIGLGATMALLKTYITGFGGDIWVYSKQNFGTMFTFVLPLK